MASVSLIYLILARISDKNVTNNTENNLNDIFDIFKNTFDENKFEFYLQTHLPKVLGSYENKTFFNNYQKYIKMYEINKSSKNQYLTFFD